MGRLKVRLISATTKKQSLTEFHVLEGKGQNLLSCQTSIDLGLVVFTNTVAGTSLNDVLKSYSDRFQGIGKIKDTLISLHINKDIQPIPQRERRIPFHVREQVDQELKRLEQLDIIEKADGPTPWISPVVIIPKSEGVRICIDSRAVNTAIERERHPMPTIEDLITDLNGACIFSKIDLNKGYHQLELAPESRYITTFVTSQGLYRYKRLCFGINSASEIFQKQISDMLSGIKGVKNMSDDIIIYSTNMAEHITSVKDVLQRMRECNITANQGKCEFGKATIKFYGHIFSKEGVTACAQKVADLEQASRPQNCSEVRSLLGMSQYLARFVPGYTDTVAPLRLLTHNDVKWRWGPPEEESFLALKKSLSNCQTVSYFDINISTELIVDASPIGLGAILTQRTSQDDLKVVAYASRSLTDTESRYSQIEREMLAVVWACEHFHLYLYGAEFILLSDHKPLESIINKVANTTVRLERLSLRLQPYKLHVKYRPGKDNPADYLSRHPVKSTATTSRSSLDEQIMQVYVNALHTYDKQGLPTEEVRNASRADPVLQKLAKAIITQDWSDSDVTPYKCVREELSIADGFILRGSRLIVPVKLQQRAIDLAHSSHQGIVKTKSLLRESLWFPGIDKMVESTVSHCIPCQAATPKQTKSLEPLKMSQLPAAPWKELSMDFCGPFANGTYLLVIIDDYSRFPEVEIIKSLTADTVIEHVDAIFSRQGIPEVVRTDNGPPFNGHQFTHWLENVVGCKHRRITPLWPRANGEAERFMRTLGKFIRATVVERGSWKQELNRFLRLYRATPHSTTQATPSEMLNSRKLRTEMPSLPVKRKVRFADQEEIIRQRDNRLKETMKHLADNRNHAKSSDIQPGDTVLLPQRKEHKVDPPFNPLPYEVNARKGTMVTMTRGNHSVTRNASLVKKIPHSVTVDVEEEIESHVPSTKVRGDETTTGDGSTSWTTDSMPSPSLEKQRPSRERAPPQRFKDFVMNMVNQLMIKYDLDCDHIKGEVLEPLP